MNLLRHGTAFLFVMLAFACSERPKKVAGGVDKKAERYTFAVPGKWTTEEFSFPVSFAPQLPYKGMEVLRFAPGWGNIGSDEHWSYTFLWWLEGQPSFDAAILQRNLTDYYTGLLQQNVRERNIPSQKVQLPSVFIQQAETLPNDAATWNGTITMTNYMDVLYKSITLNCVIHKKQCGQNTAIIVEVSLQSAEHPVKKEMSKLANDFNCQ